MTTAVVGVLGVLRGLRPDLPVMARTRDESHVDELRQAGAVEVVPETLVTALMIAAHALLLLDVPLTRGLRRIQRQRVDRYRLLGEFIRGEGGVDDDTQPRAAERLHPVLLPPRSSAVGRLLKELSLPGVSVAALVRDGRRRADPPGDELLEAGDVLVLFGADLDVRNAEQRLLE